MWRFCVVLTQGGENIKRHNIELYSIGFQRKNGFFVGVKEKKFANVIVLEFLKKFSGELYIISLPAIAVSVQTSHADVQRLLTFFFLGVALAQFFAGPWSDSIGRRRVLLMLLPAFVIGSLICTIGFMALLYLGIFIIGLGIGSAPALGKAIIFDLYKKSKALTNVFVIASAIVVWAPAIAMILGGYIASVMHWRFIFILSAVIGIFAFFLTYFMLTESFQPKRTALNFQVLLNHYWQLIKKLPILLVLLAMGFFSSGVIAYYSAGIFIFSHTLGISLHWIGYFAVFIVLANLVGKFTASRFVEKFGRPRIILFGIGLSCLASLSMLGFAQFFETSVASIILPMMFYMIGLGATMPSARILLFEKVPEQVASCSSLLSIFNSLFGALAAFLISHLHIESALPLSLYLLILTGFAWLACYWVFLRKLEF